MSIKQISADTKWRIVASSFIFNPTSAVKELIDNSIDAHGNTITIDIDSKTGGCEYICVRDDGDGVTMKDREMMCLNHSTSKITTLSDIGTITTLGFRGEALFLLSTLASTQGSLEVITRTKNDSIGERWVTNKDGSIIPKSRRKIPFLKGTSITIKNLMNGLRARRKELEVKASKTIRDITQLINHYSIEFRDIRFVFSLVSLSKNGSINNKQLQSSINIKLSRVRTLSNMVGLRKSFELNFWYDEKVTINNLFSVDYVIPNMLPEFEIIEKKKPFKFISINHRPLSNKLEVGSMINKRLNKLYMSFNLLEPHVWYINFNCSGNLIDINIEPEKNNVLINNIEEIMDDFEREMTLILKAKMEEIKKIKEEKEFQRFESSRPTIVNDENNSINLEDDEERDNIFSDADSDLNKAFSPKKKTQEITQENTTVLDDEEIYPTVKKRKLTTESFASEDDTKWGKLLLDENEAMSEDKLDKGEDLPSSLTNNYEQSNFVDDDLELSRDISLSNPFTIAKMKRSKNNINKADSHTLQLNKIEKGKKFDQLPSMDKTPLRKTKAPNNNEGNNSNNLKKKKVKNTIIRGTRTLSLFSEYTNSYTSTINYNKVKRTGPNTETQGLKRDKIRISKSIIIELSNLTHDTVIETHNKLILTKKGWYLYQGTEKNN